MEVHVVVNVVSGVVQHVRVFEDKEQAQTVLERVKLLTAFSKDEDCDLITCEVE